MNDKPHYPTVGDVCLLMQAYALSGNNGLTADAYAALGTAHRTLKHRKPDTMLHTVREDVLSDGTLANTNAIAKWWEEVQNAFAVIVLMEQRGGLALARTLLARHQALHASRKVWQATPLWERLFTGRHNALAAQYKQDRQETNLLRHAMRFVGAGDLNSMRHRMKRSGFDQTQLEHVQRLVKAHTGKYIRLTAT